MEGAAGLSGWLNWLEATPLSLAMRYSLWLYPIVEIIHIVGFVVLVGAVAMFDFRVLGASRFVPVQTLGRHLLPWSVAGLMLIVPAGLMLLSAHPHEFVENRIFLIKLALIATAGINALLFHIGIYRSVGEWNVDLPAPVLAKIHAVVSLALWVAVISCGRLLAYT
jgi:hypothetical protein